MNQEARKKRVDVSIEKLRKFVRDFPFHQIIIEDVKSEDAMTEAIKVGQEKYFVDFHSKNFGKWSKILPRTPEDTLKKYEKVLPPSYLFFLREYGSLTWVVSPDFLPDNTGFLCGNVSGGGSGILHLPSIDEVMKLHDDCLPKKDIGEDYEKYGFHKATIFHGGWSINGFAFDGRLTDKDGEQQVLYFDIEGRGGFMPTEELSSEEPFGTFDEWLEKEIDKLIDALLPKFSE